MLRRGLSVLSEWLRLPARWKVRNDFALELYEGVKTTVPLVGSEGRTIPAGSVGVIVDVSAAAYLIEITAGPEMDFSFCDALVWARRDELVLC